MINNNPIITKGKLCELIKYAIDCELVMINSTCQSEEQNEAIQKMNAVKNLLVIAAEKHFDDIKPSDYLGEEEVTNNYCDLQQDLTADPYRVLQIISSMAIELCEWFDKMDKANLFKDNQIERNKQYEKDIIDLIKELGNNVSEFSTPLKEEYFIIDIYDNHDSYYGDVIFVKANPIETNSIGQRSAVETTYHDTQYFEFPNDRTIINPLVRIAKGQGIWHPSKDDFVIQNILAEDSNKQFQLFQHKSFWSDDYDCTLNSGKTPELISNKELKANLLKEQYFNSGWYLEMGLSDYVKSVSEGDKHFWSWLFDDHALDGIKSYNLPTYYKEAFRTFINLFE